MYKKDRGMRPFIDNLFDSQLTMGVVEGLEKPFKEEEEEEVQKTVFSMLENNQMRHNESVCKILFER